MPYQAVKLEGMAEILRALGRIDAVLPRRFQERLAKLAEPVRARAQELAGSSIRNITPEWEEMRLGVTTTTVYVAPAARRRRGSRPTVGRPNLAGLLMSRAMVPAGEELIPVVTAGLQDLVDEVAHEEGFTVV